MGDLKDWKLWAHYIPHASLTYKTTDGLETRVMDGSATQDCFDAEPDELRIVTRSTVNLNDLGMYFYHIQFWCWTGESLAGIDTAHGSEEIDVCVWEEGITWLIDGDWAAEGCGDDDDCDAGYICSDEGCIEGCRADADCDTGYVCTDNVCVIEPAETECTIDADCLSGYECIANECILELDEDEPLDVPIPVLLPPCIDTDSGRDYLSQGMILSGVERSDQCINSVKLRERYCDTELTYTVEDVNCLDLYGAGWGCLEGECIELTTSSNSYWFLLIILGALYYYNKQSIKKKTKRRR